jgi:exoribonuclease R
MTYEEAQIKIDDPTQHDNLAKSLRGLNTLAKILKKRRIENGYVITTICIKLNMALISLMNYLLAECERLVNVFLYDCLAPELNSCSDVQNTGI